MKTREVDGFIYQVNEKTDKLIARKSIEYTTDAYFSFEGMSPTAIADKCSYWAKEVPRNARLAVGGISRTYVWLWEELESQERYDRRLSYESFAQAQELGIKAITAQKAKLVELLKEYGHPDTWPENMKVLEPVNKSPEDCIGIPVEIKKIEDNLNKFDVKN